ncbi:DUF2934 domain-containing protein [Methylomonas sp. 2BW1-5-20]|uniref:DUF2934 domain-containing protein n=1 Tax=Methylomonas sp. 2BW1-5-20 TaxID=3376686 RepID=UPI004052CB5C
MSLLTKPNELTNEKTSQQDIEAKAEYQKQLSCQEIAEVAYFKAEKRGFLPGYELGDWLEAEKEVSLT